MSPKLRLHRDTLVGLVAALVAFVVYLTTLAPSVSQEDCGEIAASLYTLGIMHPTGYPLFALLGWAFSHLPLGGRVIWKLNLLMALLCAGAVFAFFKLFTFMFSETARQLFRGKAGAPLPPVYDRAAAVTAVLILAFSREFWLQAVSLEVYSLHLLFVSAVTLLFLRALAEHEQSPGPTENRWWAAFALLLGVSFAHHLMMMLLAPAFLYLYFTVHGFRAPAWRKIGRGIPFFLIGLVFYLYLPLRAAQKPLMNWSDPTAWESFWWHISGRMYHTQMFRSFDASFTEAVRFLSRFPKQFGYHGLLLGLLGLWALLRGNRRALLFSLLIFLTCLLFAFGWAVDNPAYYLTACVAASTWIAFGLRSILRFAAGRTSLRLAAGLLCAVSIVFPLALRYRAVNKSENYLLEDYTRNILESLEPDAVLLTSQYTTLTAIAYYLQLVEGVRTDVVVLDTQLMKFPWYYTQLERQHDSILWGSRTKMAAFFRANEEFERSDDMDNAAFVRHAFSQYVDVIQSIVENAYNTRPIYETMETGLDRTMRFEKIPSGLVFRLYRDSAPPFVARQFDVRPLPRNDSNVRRIRRFYAQAYMNQSVYLALVAKDKDSAVQMVRKAVAMEPNSPEPAAWLQHLESTP